MVGPRERDPLESTTGQEGVSLRSTASGVVWPRASPKLIIIKAPVKFGRPGKYPLLIPTGRDNHGGGDTVEGATVGAWRPRASTLQTVIIDKERWFSKPHPQYQKGETKLTRDSCMRCRDATIRTTIGKPLGQRRPMRGSRPRR